MRVSKANFNTGKRIYNWPPFMKVVYEEHQELPLGKNDARCHMKRDANYWAEARLSVEENTFL